MFRMKGAFVTNERGKVMDISGNKDQENQNIHAWKRHGGLNQQWDIIYKDQWEKDPKKGELNKRFGLKVDTTFYIVSHLRGGRYIDLINNRNMVIKTKNGRRTQEWYFHQQSLTIRTRLNNQSWDIQNNGRTNEMRIWSSNNNSLWW
jgi:hypothetical protein